RLAVLHLLEKLQQRLRRRQLDPQRQRVDEQPHHALNAGNLRRPSRHRHPKHNVVTSAHSAEQETPCHLHEGIERQTMPARLLPLPPPRASPGPHPPPPRTPRPPPGGLLPPPPSPPPPRRAPQRDPPPPATPDNRGRASPAPAPPHPPCARRAWAAHAPAQAATSHPSAGDGG